MIFYPAWRFLLVGLYIAYCVRAVPVAYYLLTNEFRDECSSPEWAFCSLCNIDVLICKFYSQLPSLLSTIEGTFLNIFGTETAFLYFFCITGHILYATACYKLGMEFPGRPLGGLVCYAITIASSVPVALWGMGFMVVSGSSLRVSYFRRLGIFAFICTRGTNQVGFAYCWAFNELSSSHRCNHIFISGCDMRISAKADGVSPDLLPPQSSWFAPCLSPIAPAKPLWLTWSKHC